jgi:hypothetical protein
VDSGETVSVNYTWENRGNYNVRVKVRDEHWLEGDWSDPLPIIMPKSYSWSIFEKLTEWFISAFGREIFLISEVS